MIQNQWYAVLPSKYVTKGSLTALRRLGVDVCFFRTESDELGCITDKCTHRGAALSKGVHKGDCVACPFHGLQFNPEGKCTLIPALGKNTPPESRFNITAYPVHEAHNMIYMWYGDPTLINGEIPFFDDIADIEKNGSYSELSDTWNTHYSRCIENQLDVIHLPFVHYNTIGRGNKTLVNGPAIEVSGTSITVSAHNSHDEGQKPLPQSECIINPHLHLQFLFPNIWQNYIADRQRIIIFFAPVDDEHTIFYIRFYSKQFRTKILNTALAHMGKYANKIIEKQDKRIVETQIPKKSALHCGENLLPGDNPVIHYRKIRAELQQKALHT